MVEYEKSRVTLRTRGGGGRENIDCHGQRASNVDMKDRSFENRERSTLEALWGDVRAGIVVHSRVSVRSSCNGSSKILEEERRKGEMGSDDVLAR
jgi:hypothetical protein